MTTPKRYVSFTSGGKRHRYSIPEGIDPAVLRKLFEVKSKAMTIDIYQRTLAVKPDVTDKMRRMSQVKLAEALLETPKMKDVSPEVATVCKGAGAVIMSLLAEVDSLKALLKAKQRKK